MRRLLAPRPLRLLISAAVAVGAAAVGGASTVQAGDSGGGVTFTSYGHSAVMVQGGGMRVLLNPFKSVGCAAGLAEPRVQADVILANSRLLDEGAPVASGRFLSKPGSYRVGQLQFEGIANPHDRLAGRRFGQATIWRWRQGGLEIAHLGSTAGPLSSTDQVLLGRPDVLIIGVGGGAKVYTGQEAAEIVRQLKPRRVIPVQTLNGRQVQDCDLTSVEPFLQSMAGTPVKRPGASVTLTPPLGEGTTIMVLR
jgi:L-ascorbate metabolism protein UlaG (beta-lactamase superfamily)